MSFAILVIHRSVCDLQQLARNHSRGTRIDYLVWPKFQHGLFFHFGISCLCFIVQLDSANYVNPLGQFQIITGFHADANIGNTAVYLVLCSVLRYPVINDITIPAAGIEITVAVFCQRSTQTLAPIQQINLRPQINQAVRTGCASQADNMLDKRPHLTHRLEPLGTWALETGKLVQNHAVKRPFCAVILYQPRDILSVDAINIGIGFQGTDPLRLTPQNANHAKPPQVIPLCAFLGPCVLRHTKRRHHQNLVDFKPVVQPACNSGQRDNRLAGPKPISSKRPAAGLSIRKSSQNFWYSWGMNFIRHHLLHHLVNGGLAVGNINCKAKIPQHTMHTQLPLARFLTGVL